MGEETSQRRDKRGQRGESLARTEHRGTAPRNAEVEQGHAPFARALVHRPVLHQLVLACVCVACRYGRSARISWRKRPRRPSRLLQARMARQQARDSSLSGADEAIHRRCASSATLIFLALCFCAVFLASLATVLSKVYTAYCGCTWMHWHLDAHARSRAM